MCSGHVRGILGTCRTEHIEDVLGHIRDISDVYERYAGQDILGTYGHIFGTTRQHMLRTYSGHIKSILGTY